MPLLLFIFLGLTQLSHACDFGELVAQSAKFKAKSFPVLNEFLTRFEKNKETQLYFLALEIEDSKAALNIKSLAELTFEIDQRSQILVEQTHILSNAVYTLIDLAPRKDEVPPILEEIIKIGTFLRLVNVPDHLKEAVLDLLSQGTSTLPSDPNTDQFSEIVHSRAFNKLKELLLDWQIEGDSDGGELYLFDAKKWHLQASD